MHVHLYAQGFNCVCVCVKTPKQPCDFLASQASCSIQATKNRVLLESYATRDYPGHPSCVWEHTGLHWRDSQEAI